jgi:hypothetical protein
LLSNWWNQCSLSDNPNAQKWRLQRAFFKIHRKDFSLAGGKASVCKRNVKLILNTIHVNMKNPRNNHEHG